MFKQFLETEMTWSQPIIVRDVFSRIRTYVSLRVKGYKGNKPILTSIKKQGLPLFNFTQWEDKCASYSFTTKKLTNSMCQVTLVVKYSNLISD